MPPRRSDGDSGVDQSSGGPRSECRFPARVYVQVFKGDSKCRMLWDLPGHHPILITQLRLQHERDAPGTLEIARLVHCSPPTKTPS